jgi:hypothetical protein
MKKMAIKYNANYIETIPFSDVCLQLNLAANTAQSWTVPGTSDQFFQAYFEYNSNSNVFVCNNGIAAAPGGGAQTTQQYNEFKPIKRYVRGGDILSFVTPDPVAVMGVSLRQLQGN